MASMSIGGFNPFNPMDDLRNYVDQQVSRQQHAMQSEYIRHMQAMQQAQQAMPPLAGMDGRFTAVAVGGGGAGSSSGCIAVASGTATVIYPQVPTNKKLLLL